MRGRRLLVGLVLLAGLVGIGAWLWRGRDGGEETTAATREARQRRERAARLPPAGPPAPEGVEVASFDEPLVFGAGHTVVVHDYAAGLTLEAGDGAPALVADAVRVEVCAGDSRLVGGALPAAFALGYPVRGGGFEVRTGASGLAAREPPLSTSLAGEELAAGECREGWVTIPLGEGEEIDERPPASVLFDNTAYGFVPEAHRARHAWVLE